MQEDNIFIGGIDILFLINMRGGGGNEMTTHTLKLKKHTKMNEITDSDIALFILKLIGVMVKVDEVPSHKMEVVWN